MQFEFSTASKIIFGSGKLDLIGEIAVEFGKRALIISGAPTELTDKLAKILRSKSLISVKIDVHHEPTIENIRQVLQNAANAAPELVIGIGGGSAIDTSKVTAALLSNPGDITNYLEIIGAGHPLINPSLPLIAVPTTSGTGSEVTKNAVIASTSHHVKVSLRSLHLLPRIALIDPQLTISVPQSTTATTGLDAFTQLVEAYTCNVPNPITDALCIEGIRRVVRSFLTAYDYGNNLAAREDMSLAALFSGLSLANAKLGAVHGLAGPIGGLILAHHGAICAALLANVMAANLSALRNRSPDHPAVERYTIIARLLNADSTAVAQDGVQWVRDICRHTHIQSLSLLGLTEQLFPLVIEKALISSSMKGNPVTLSSEELRIILQSAL
jgi:alcohol dehydrogenase class IV